MARCESRPCRQTLRVRSGAPLHASRTRRNRDNHLFAGLTLSEIFLEWLPIVGPPTFSEVRSLSLRETGMVKNNFGSRALFDKLESRNRVLTRPPAGRAPCLDNPFVWNELEVASHDVAAKGGESSAHLRTDFRGFVFWDHAGLHRSTKHHHFIELLGVRKRFINALAACLEHNFLVDDFASARNIVGSVRVGASGAHCHATESPRRANQHLASRDCIHTPWLLPCIAPHSFKHHFLRDFVSNRSCGTARSFGMEARIQNT